MIGALDKGKVRYDLIPAEPLRLVAAVFTSGAGKYGDNDWRGGIRWGRRFASILRHLWKFWAGEDTDPESGLPHLAHAITQAIMLLEYTFTKPNLDDRIYDRTLRDNVQMRGGTRSSVLATEDFASTSGGI